MEVNVDGFFFADIDSTELGDPLVPKIPAILSKNLEFLEKSWDYVSWEKWEFCKSQLK